MNEELILQRAELTKEYDFYIKGLISEDEYLERIKPIDQKIDNLEMSTLRGILALKESFLQLSQKQGN